MFLLIIGKSGMYLLRNCFHNLPRALHYMLVKTFITLCKLLKSYKFTLSYTGAVFREIKMDSAVDLVFDPADRQLTVLIACFVVAAICVHHSLCCRVVSTRQNTSVGRFLQKSIYAIAIWFIYHLFSLPQWFCLIN